MGRVPPNATPGTGEQVYMIACENPDDHPRLSEEIDQLVEEEDMLREEAIMSKRQYRHGGRTWQCGGEYWDTEINDLVTLESVVRRSSWCNTSDAEDAPIYLRFNYDGAHNTTKVKKSQKTFDLKERFLPRYNVPY